MLSVIWVLVIVPLWLIVSTPTSTTSPPPKLKAKTDLSITQTEHWLYLIPSKTEQPSQILWVASLISPDTLLIKADQVIVNQGLHMWGTWHGIFTRMHP